MFLARYAGLLRLQATSRFFFRGSYIFIIIVSLAINNEFRSTAIILILEMLIGYIWYIERLTLRVQLSAFRDSIKRVEMQSRQWEDANASLEYHAYHRPMITIYYRLLDMEPAFWLILSMGNTLFLSHLAAR